MTLASEAGTAYTVAKGVRFMAVFLVPSNEFESRLRQAVLEALAAGADSGSLSEFPAIVAACSDQLVVCAARQGVSPVLAHCLSMSADDSDTGSQLRRSHEESAGRVRVQLEELDSLAQGMACQGIRSVALKNTGIARGIYPCAACCPMGDLDVLVERSRFRDAHEIVQALGFEWTSRSVVEEPDLERALEVGGGTEYVKEVEGIDVWLELQWRPVAGRWIRKDQEPDGADLIARSVPIEGTSVRLLSPVDNMIQVALHTAKHSYVRAPGLRLHTDVDRLAHYYTPDWAEVVAEAKRLEVQAAVYFSLAIPKAIFDSPIPDWVLDDLRPPTWKERWIALWIRRADLFNPDKKKFSRPGMMIFHGLLYDDFLGLMASVCDTDKASMRWRNSPTLVVQAIRRLSDIVTRHQP